jgi:hypothetical protein
MDKTSVRRFVLFSVCILIVICAGAAVYHLGYVRGLQAGLEWAKGNTQNAIVRNLGALKSVEKEQDRKTIWGIFSADFEELLITEKMSQSAKMGLIKNLQSTITGEGAIYNMSAFVRPIDGRITVVHDVCQKVSQKKEYAAYCEGLVLQSQIKLHK